MTRQEKYPDTTTFHWHNENPKNRVTGDCAFRAIATALRIPYNQVVMEMAELQCKTGYALNDSKGIAKYLASKGWVKHAQPRKADGTKYTGKEFCKELNCNIAAVGVTIIANIGGKHIVCIKEDCWHGLHKVHDIWDSTGGCIGNYWTEGK